MLTQLVLRPIAAHPPAGTLPDQPTAAATAHDPKDDLLLEVGQPPSSTRRVTVATERRSITAPVLRPGITRSIVVHMSQVPRLAWNDRLLTAGTADTPASDHRLPTTPQPSMRLAIAALRRPHASLSL